MDRLEKYAKKNNIPIMQKDGIIYLKKYIKENKIKTILEIGTAIGYSAISMALIDTSIKITSIERDKNMYEKALENIKAYHVDKQITLIYGDALDIDITGKFDLIFIDGAKAQSIKFFEKYEKNLKDNGTIITDNLNFHGLTNNIESIKSKNLKALVKKINNYKDYLLNNKNYITKFLDIGDGISISKKSF